MLSRRDWIDLAHAIARVRLRDSANQRTLDDISWELCCVLRERCDGFDGEAFSRKASAKGSADARWFVEPQSKNDTSADVSHLPVATDAGIGKRKAIQETTSVEAPKPRQAPPPRRIRLGQLCAVCIETPATHHEQIDLDGPWYAICDDCSKPMDEERGRRSA